jgi:VWFA-related protein
VSNQPLEAIVGERWTVLFKRWNIWFAAVLAVGWGLLLQVGYAQQAPGQTNSIPVIKTSAQTVLIDVVVDDHANQAVPGLTKQNFTIFEDGKPQTVTYFEAHDGLLHAAAPPKQLPPGMYSNIPGPLANDSVNVLLMDALNTPAKDQITVRRKMIEYLKTIPPGTRIAIFTLASHLRLVNGFTTDPAILVAALNRKDGLTATASPVLVTHADQAEQEKRQDNILDVSGIGDSNSTPEQRIAGINQVNAMRQFVSDEASFGDDVRVRLTLSALDQLGRYLSALPGRKNLIWFSGSFPLSVNPDFNQTDAYRGMRDYGETVRKTAQRLALARVAVYPIDARGLFQNSVFGSDNGPESKFRNSNYRTENVDREFMNITSEHDTMDDIAQQTGGKAIYNSNDLKGALAQAIDNGSHYYTLAYDPPAPTKRGGFRKIEVKVDQPGYQLLYRRGYLSPEASAPAAEHDSKAKETFQTAMAPGVPPASEILFRVQPVAEEHQPSATDKEKGDNPQVQKPTVRYVISYTADINAIHLTATDDGIRHGSLLSMVIAYDQQGKALNSTLYALKIDLEPKVYAELQRTGMPFYQELDIPLGEVVLRTGIYDPGSGKMGSLEFPITIKPAAAATAAP